MAVWEKVLFLVSFDFSNQNNKGSLEGYAFWNDKAEIGYTQHIYWIVESFTEHGASGNKYGAWECPVCCFGATLSRNRMRILSPALTCICGSEFLAVRKKCSNLHEIFASSLILAPVSVWKSFALAGSFIMTLCDGCMDVCVCSEVSIRKAQAKVVSIWRRQGASNRSFELWALPLLALHVTWSMQLVLGFLIQHGIPLCSSFTLQRHKAYCLTNPHPDFPATITMTWLGQRLSGQVLAGLLIWGHSFEDSISGTQHFKHHKQS